MSAPQRSRGGRPAVLSEEKIIAAALAVIDAEGLDGLSMRRVGALLGVEAMALYRHVPNKNAMLAAVVDHLTAGAATRPAPGTPWTDALAGFGHRYRDVLLGHPAAVPLLATHPVSPATAEALLTPILETVDHAGVTVERIQFAFQSVAVFVLGHALAQVGTPPGDGPATRSASTSYYDAWFEAGLSALRRGFAVTPAPDDGPL
ncbi:TetR family transcriptional regulator [Streptosporangium sp. NPDC051022]|uniref:TetR family transcriptional regulator n=1 Tax=Streptosporangium sp. NPDC051022 TaxID=3155752 RepID=UPI00341B6DC4